MTPMTRHALAVLIGFASFGLAHADGGTIARGDTDSSRSVGTVVDDSVITGQVKTKLLQSDSVGGLDIDVDTRAGVVQLTGDVKNKAESELAEELATNVDGVKMVQNDLRVRK